MDDPDPPDNDWIQRWIEQQRDSLHARGARQAGADGSENVRQELLGLGEKWLDLGQAYLNGLQQFANGVADAAPQGRTAASKLGEEFMRAWRGQMESPQQAQSSRSAGTDVWSEVLRQLPPIGLAREHSVALRQLVQAQAECQRLEQALRTMLYGVQIEALNLVERRMAAHQAECGTLGFRELYDLWIECGEQVYAQVAHSEAYCQLQAQLGNATCQLRACQQKLIEHALKQFDLPTRSELNSVHRQLRDQARTLRELQAQLDAARSATPAQPPNEGA